MFEHFEEFAAEARPSLTLEHNEEKKKVVFEDSELKVKGKVIFYVDENLQGEKVLKFTFRKKEGDIYCFNELLSQWKVFVQEFIE